MVNYFTARAEEDQFLDPSFMDYTDENQHEDIQSAVNNLKKSAADKGMPEKNCRKLAKMIAEQMEIFRTSFSPGLTAKLPLIKIELSPDAKTVKARLHKYSYDQKDFSQKFFNKLSQKRLAYQNPTFKWDCAPLLVPKPGTEYHFTPYLRSVNKFKIPHHFPMLVIEHKLSNLAK